MKREDIISYLFGLIVIIWLGLLLAPVIDKGLFDIIDYISKLNNPFNISFYNNSFKSVIVLVLIYSLIMYVYFESRRNYRKGEEYGSAKWGNKRNMKNEYMQEPIEQNKILTKNISIGLNTKKHRRNLNTIVIGGSGAGKTRFYAKPNIMQANTSFVVLDPKGEILRDTGNLLKEKGYEIKVLDLINMEKSHCYNPFVYINSDNDIQKLVTNIFKSTTPKGSVAQDPFWDTMAAALLNALMFYLWYEAPEDEQNFSMVMEMIRAGDINEEEDDHATPLDLLFNQLEYENPNHVALKYYRSYRSGSAKTLKSILVTLVSRLEKFNLPTVASLTQYDEMNLSSIGEVKTAIFAIIPDNDPSFNFLVSILYTQLFQQLFYLADKKYRGSLPVQVHFLMDEFANVSLPDDFEKILSVMRSRGIFVSIILQNLAQLKALFEKQWESIVGNCDEFLYLGGMEQSTHKYISEFLGKETIDTNTYGYTKGRNGSYSTNYQINGRELLTPDEIRLLNNDYSILFIRGERPIKDRKYNILKHPNIKLSVDGGGKEYEHGSIEYSTASINLDFDINVKDLKLERVNAKNYVLLSSEELDDFFNKKKEGNKNGKKKEI